MAADAALQRAYDNYARILVLCTEAIANPTTQEAIDAVISAASTSNIVQPQLTHSKDGETYNWTEYQTFLVQQLTALRALMQVSSGPWEIRTRGMV